MLLPTGLQAYSSLTSAGLDELSVIAVGEPAPEMLSEEISTFRRVKTPPRSEIFTVPTDLPVALVSKSSASFAELATTTLNARPPEPAGEAEINGSSPIGSSMMSVAGPIFLGGMDLSASEIA
jgi:hypothetical protein